MNRLLNLVWICLGASVALLAAEVLLRLGAPRHEASFYTASTDRGFALRPDAAGWQTTEGENYVRINSAGLKDREHTLQRPPNTIRIAVIGSSETAAMQVSPEQSFTGLLEHNLNKRLQGSPQNVETLNFGVDGYNLAQIYFTLHNHVWQYDPQIVILCYPHFLALKNIPDLSPDVPDKTRYLVFRDGKPELDEGSRAAIARTPAARKTYWRDRLADFTNRSSLLTLLNYSVVISSRKLATLKPAKAPTGGSAAKLPPDYVKWWTYLSPDDTLPPADPLLIKSSRIGDQIIRLIDSEVREHGAEFRFFALDQPMQLTPDAAVRAAFVKERGLVALDRADRRVVDFCNQNGIPAEALMGSLAPMIPPGAAIRGFGEERGTGHYNLLGHQLIGEHLAATLLRNSAVLNKAVR